jgi:acylphosphatase
MEKSYNGHMQKGRVHLIIYGYVQGVFFRASTRDKAMNLGLKGWVRNLYDGSVEAVFEGDIEKLKEAVAWCQNGPPGASVTKIDEKWNDYIGEYKSFDVRYG